MNQQELSALKAKVDADDPTAMYIYSEVIRPTDPAEADKYITLAAMLGQPNAMEKLADKYLESNNYTAAAHYYKAGSKAGLTECAVKLAIINLSANDYTALHELEDLAESGVKSACSALAAYHKAQGNRKEYNFWHSLEK